MSLRFWTTLQYLKQAALIENGEIIKTIPAHPPKTIFRRAGVVCEFTDKLALAKHASFELWDRQGEECYRSFHHELILAPHDICQYGQNLLVCSSGLELFLVMDIDGEIKWHWWGHENGLGGKNEHFFDKDWILKQTTSDMCEAPPEDQAHYNSIFLTGNGKFITAALRKKKIIEITVGQPGYKLVAEVGEEGCHSPIYHDGILIYGTKAGIKVGEKLVLEEYEWVKHVRAFEDGFAFTHDRGAVITDGGWRPKEEIPLPSPYGFAFLERLT